MKLNGSDIIAECLLEQGVDTVFGYPGGAVLNIYDALYKYSDRIMHILTAHEQGASHAADGYARATGKTGVVIATSGPGATNLITGLATAKMDSSPVVAITGNVTRDCLGRDSFQEVDIKSIAAPVTKKSYCVMSMEELATTIREAFEIANSGRKGPVLIDIPKDITALETEYEPMAPKKIECYVKDGNDYQKAVQLIMASKRPFIYAGGGVIGSGASKELLALAKKIDAPVCCSLMGIGGMPGDEELYFGNLGMHGMYETGMATLNADCIIAVGSRFSDRVAGDRKKFGENATIIHFDIDEKEIDKNIITDCAILGEIRETVEIVTELLPQLEHKQWIEQLRQWKKDGEIKQCESGYPSPYHILSAVQKMKNDDDIIVTDVGQHQMWAAQFCKFNKPRTFLTSGGLGTMGFGMGASIGAQCGKADSRVTLITGDGSFHMNLNELVTLKSYNIPIVVCVMNNTVLGMVRQWQKLFYGRRFSQTDPHRATDFAALARSFGVEGMTVTKPEEVEAALEKAYSLNAPVVIDFHISPDANVLPMIPPGKTADAMIMELD